MHHLVREDQDFQRNLHYLVDRVGPRAQVSHYHLGDQETLLLRLSLAYRESLLFQDCLEAQKALVGQLVLEVQVAPKNLVYQEIQPAPEVQKVLLDRHLLVVLVVRLGHVTQGSLEVLWVPFVPVDLEYLDFLKVQLDRVDLGHRLDLAILVDLERRPGLDHRWVLKVLKVRWVQQDQEVLKHQGLL